MTAARRQAYRLKVVRAMKDMTQAQVARHAGMSQTRYFQIENGEGRAPNNDEQDAVADALGVTVAEIEWPELAAVKAS